MTTIDAQPTGEIHPAADLFPMLPDDELADLAADIKANGLVHPIVLDGNGVLIDGRNRLAACRMAGIEPAFTALNGHDPVAYILSANVSRRNLSKGQRAMAVASLLNFSTREAAGLVSVDYSYISQARTVLSYADELRDAVMDGSLALSDAYAEARDRKQAKESSEARAHRTREDFSRLYQAAPDLAVLVREERMTLTEALAAWQERERHDREDRRDTTEFFAKAVVSLWSVVLHDPERIAARWLSEAATKHRAPGAQHLWTSEGLRDLARSLESVADAFDRHHGGIVP